MHHRFYMTPETQQAVIAESNRLIAMRALNAARRRFERSHGGAPYESHARMPDDEAPTNSDSAFARLVAALAATTGGPDLG